MQRRYDQIFQWAIDGQSACNTSGLLLDIGNQIEALNCELHAKNEWSTEKVAHHPIVRLLIEQLVHLYGQGLSLDDPQGTYSQAYDACKTLALKAPEEYYLANADSIASDSFREELMLWANKRGLIFRGQPAEANGYANDEAEISVIGSSMDEDFLYVSWSVLAHVVAFHGGNFDTPREGQSDGIHS